MGTTTYLALYSATDAVSYGEICEVAYTLQRQLTEHFTPLWGVTAVISPVADLASMASLPLNCAPIVICDRDSVGDGGTFGLHMVEDYGTPSTGDDRPFALVEYQPNKWWSLDASHECLEMVMDPYGSQFWSGPDPAGYGWTVDYLVEICDPCGRREAAYLMPESEWPVSDFVLPGYYNEAINAGGTFSCRNQLVYPRSLLPGGYLAWCTQKPGAQKGEGDWYMTSYDGTGTPVTERKGSPVLTSDSRHNLRQWVDLASRDFVRKDARCRKTREAMRNLEVKRKAATQHLRSKRKTHAAMWKKTIEAAVSSSKKKGAGPRH